MSEKETTVRSLVSEVQAGLIEDLSVAKKEKLRTMMIEIEGMKTLLKKREAQLEEFLNEPLEVTGDDVFLLG